MEKLPKEFIGRVVRAVIFIGLVTVGCAGVALLGMSAASRFRLTTSRTQVPLTRVAIVGEEAAVPLSGKVTEGNGWVLRNSRGQYTLTLDGLEAGSAEEETPALKIEGDLTIILKKGTQNRLLSAGTALKKGKGTLTIRGEGRLEAQGGAAAIWADWGGGALDPEHPSAIRIEGGILELEGKELGIRDETIELEQGRITIFIQDEHGVGIETNSLRDGDFSGSLDIQGGEMDIKNAAAVPE